MSEQHQTSVRRLRYRLQRQGMLELDDWLSPLYAALEHGDAKVIQAIDCLIVCEVPELLAMQAGMQKIPKELESWLNI